TIGACQQRCENLQGSFQCLCTEGFVLSDDGRTCIDVDECSSDDVNCQDKCFNTEGSFTCGCTRGFILGDDQRSCSPEVGCLGSRQANQTLRWRLKIGTKSNDFGNQKIVKSFRKKVNLSLRFRTFDNDGVLLGVSDSTGDTYIYIIIRNRQLEAGIKRASGGLVVLTANSSVSNGKWNTVNLKKIGTSAALIINGTTFARKRVHSLAPKFKTGTLIYLGGLPKNHTITDTIGIDPQYTGCMSHIRSKGCKVKWFPSKPDLFSEHTGCYESIQSGSYFDGTGYLQLGSSQIRVVTYFKFRALIRTSYPNGVLVSAGTNTGGKLMLSLVDGAIRAQVMNISGTSLYFSSYAKEGRLLCTGLWMSVYCKISSRGKISLYVDGQSGSQVGKGLKFRFDPTQPIYIGGLPSDSSSNFNGNMRKIFVNDRSVDLSKSSNYVGVDAFSMPAMR
uniref:Laminin G domain-containing protein n=1 Tax=Ciona savignyi TaxID=51511 RepID=H2ZIZ7_CIOSA